MKFPLAYFCLTKLQMLPSPEPQSTLETFSSRPGQHLLNPDLNSAKSIVLRPNYVQHFTAGVPAHIEEIYVVYEFTCPGHGFDRDTRDPHSSSHSIGRMLNEGADL